MISNPPHKLFPVRSIPPAVGEGFRTIMRHVVNNSLMEHKDDFVSEMKNSLRVSFLTQEHGRQVERYIAVILILVI
jgi:hypothetical protein